MNEKTSTAKRYADSTIKLLGSSSGGGNVLRWRWLASTGCRTANAGRPAAHARTTWRPLLAHLAATMAVGDNWHD